MQTQQIPEQESVNFDLAEQQLKQAREAHAAGDHKTFVMHRTLLAVCLGLPSGTYVPGVK